MIIGQILGYIAAFSLIFLINKIDNEKVRNRLFDGIFIFTCLALVGTLAFLFYLL